MLEWFYGSDSDSNGIKLLQTAVRYPTHPFLVLTPAICIYLMVVMELWNWSPKPKLINFKSEEIEVGVVSSAAK